MHGCIYLWSWSRTKAQRPDKKSRAVCAVVLAELQWTDTEIPYLALNTCPGKSSNQQQYNSIDRLQIQISSLFSLVLFKLLLRLICFVSVCSISVWGCFSLCPVDVKMCVCSFLSLGQAYIVCGDDKGRLWTYHITNLQKTSFQTGKPIQPTEVSISSKCPRRMFQGNALS